jgi:HD-GYP domain-containing protein (c-di-GMP phosphodiesterase class II)
LVAQEKALPMTEPDPQTALTGVIAQITAAVTNTSLYSATHPQVGQYIEKAYGLLDAMLKTKQEVTFLLIGDDLVADNRPLPSGSAYVVNFIRILRRKSIERITFLPGLQRTELRDVIRDLSSPDAASVRSSTSIKLGKVELRVIQAGEYGGGGAAFVGTGAGSGVPQDTMQELLAMTAEELDELKELYLTAKKHRKIDVRSVDDMVKGFIKGFRQEMNPLSLLASLKSVHEYTFTHVTNVCILTMAQAETMGFGGENLHSIGVAALLHDVGKIFIPEDILNKPGMLTPEERRVVETHTVKGARYLMGIEGIPKLSIIAALEHHRKFDGTGYPSIKGGWTPNITSQMLSIADVFDAMRSRRSYQGDIPIEKIVDVLRKGSGSSFNPQLVDHFLRIIRYRPQQPSVPSA